MRRSATRACRTIRSCANWSRSCPCRCSCRGGCRRFRRCATRSRSRAPRGGGEPGVDEILAEVDWVMDCAVEHLGADRATRYLRKFYPWYVERLDGGRPLQAALQTAPTLEAARELLHAEPSLAAA